MKLCDHRRSSFIVDAACAAVLALEWPAGAINLVDDEPAPGTEWLPVYASVLGSPPPPMRRRVTCWGGSRSIPRGGKVSGRCSVPKRAANNRRHSWAVSSIGRRVCQ